MSWALRCARLVSFGHPRKQLNKQCSGRTYQVIPSPFLPCLASTVLSGCVRSCLTFIGPARPCLALPCTILSDLSSPVWRCSARPCLTLPGPALSGHSRPCLALLYPVWRCPVRPHPALPGAAILYLAWRCLAWPCPALSCPSPSNPAGLCPVRPDLLSTVRHCLALPNTVWPCPVRSCLTLPGHSRPCPSLSALLCSILPCFAWPCLGLPWSTLSGPACSTLPGPVWSAQMMLMVILLWTMHWVSLNCTILASRARTKTMVLASYYVHTLNEWRLQRLNRKNMSD